MEFTGGEYDGPALQASGRNRRPNDSRTQHAAHRQSAQALSGSNLQFVLDDENSVFLEFLRANDPFQR